MSKIFKVGNLNQDTSPMFSAWWVTPKNTSLGQFWSSTHFDPKCFGTPKFPRTHAMGECGFLGMYLHNALATLPSGSLIGLPAGHLHTAVRCSANLPQDLVRRAAGVTLNSPKIERGITQSGNRQQQPLKEWKLVIAPHTGSHLFGSIEQHKSWTVQYMTNRNSDVHSAIFICFCNIIHTAEVHKNNLKYSTPPGSPSQLSQGEMAAVVHQEVRVTGPSPVSPQSLGVQGKHSG